MEQMNKVELIGIVGNTYSATKSAFGVDAVRLSVATNFIYKGTDGFPIIETTWHNVVMYDASDEVKALKKGDNVHIIGRLRSDRCTDSHGSTSYTTTIVATKVEVVNKKPTIAKAETE